MCDLFLVLAQAPGGLTCFLLPRVLPDGTPQPRCACSGSRTSSATGPTPQPRSSTTARCAWLVGERGPRRAAPSSRWSTLTRLDCVLGSAAGDAAGRASQAAHHAAHRTAFGAHADRPAADGATCWPTWPLESEAATALGDAAGRRRRPGRRRRRSRGALLRLALRRRPSTGSASAAPPSSPRRWSAWAATATSRSPGCRGCTARRR